jgi:hypothetical protein
MILLPVLIFLFSSMLLERIMELEAQEPPWAEESISLSQPQSSAFPRSLLNLKARQSFVANLREVADEDGDAYGDTLLPGTRREIEDAMNTRTALRISSSGKQSNEGLFVLSFLPDYIAPPVASSSTPRKFRASSQGKY